MVQSRAQIMDKLGTTSVLRALYTFCFRRDGQNQQNERLVEKQKKKIRDKTVLGWGTKMTTGKDQQVDKILHPHNAMGPG